MTTWASPLLGAYAMSPADPAGEEEFYAGAVGLGIGGLEVPLPPQGSPWLEPWWIARNAQPAWDLIVTCIPTVMGRLGSAPGYGLASTDAPGRQQALADVARAQGMALRLADRYGRRRVAAIQVHSAPGPATGSRDALTRSLEQILSWDCAGAQILVEHCDALVSGQVAAKGFCPIEDEIAAVGEVGAAADRLALSINWGRSAIEGRSARTAVEHVRSARDAGILGALVFSGATDVSTPWGPAWTDAHIPPRGGDPALATSSASLLGPEQIAESLQAAGEGVRLVVKISVRPRDADVPTRLTVARAALDQIARGRTSATAPPQAPAAEPRPRSEVHRGSHVRQGSGTCP